MGDIDMTIAGLVSSIVASNSFTNVELLDDTSDISAATRDFVPWSPPLGKLP